MLKKQKLWFFTLFSLIFILSIYYLTIPTNNEVIQNKKENNNVNVSKINNLDMITSLELELDEERSNLVSKYNEIITNDKSSTEEKNNAYEGIKKIDKLKTEENNIKKLIKNNMKLDSFVKIDSNNIMITIKKDKHDYSLANDIMRLIQKNYKDKMYISVTFKK